MIEIFERASTSQNTRRAKQEMLAARTAQSAEAKAEHLAAAAHYFGAARDSEIPGRARL